MTTLLIVKLDDPRYGAGPGTVVGHAVDVADYHTRTTDRDGARDQRVRLWVGTAQLGDRVAALDPTERLAPARRRRVHGRALRRLWSHGRRART
jgi:hypothetical protein